MTTRAKQRKQKELLEQWQADIDRLQADNEGLLDILNAILYAQGGKVVVSRAQLIAADRRQIHVTHGKDAIVIETQRREEPEPRPITERLWLPGQP